MSSKHALSQKRRQGRKAKQDPYQLGALLAEQQILSQRALSQSMMNPLSMQRLAAASALSQAAMDPYRMSMMAAAGPYSQDLSLSQWTGSVPSAAPAMWSGVPGIPGRTAAKPLALPAKAWDGFINVFSHWDAKADDEFKWAKVCSVLDADKAEHLDSAKLKDQVILFGDDFQTDSWAIFLSPAFGVTNILPPEGIAYNSPMHYVERMRTKIGDTMGMMFGSLLDVKADTCKFSRTHATEFLQDPIPLNFAQSASVCTDASSNAENRKRFYDVSTEYTRFWLSLWIGLWSKYQKTPGFLTRLVSTNNKLLVYRSSLEGENVYGVDSNIEGTNAVGMLLMILRKMGRFGWVQNPQASKEAIYNRYVKPMLEELLDKNDRSIFA
jgi:hypothetical protein